MTEAEWRNPGENRRGAAGPGSSGGTGAGSSREGAERGGLQVCRDTDSVRIWPSRQDCEDEEGHLLPLHPRSPDHLPPGSTAATADGSQGG